MHMNRRRSLSWKTVALDAKALALGGLAGAILVACYEFADAKLAERELGTLLVPPIAQAEFALGFAIGAAIIILSISVPIWLVLARYHLDSWLAAAVLGFAVTMVFWVIHNRPGDLPGQSLPELVRSGVPLAICGSIAGIVTWWVRRPSLENGQAQSSSSS
jgi:hypothetical protein